MSEIKFSNFINEDGSGGPDLVGVTTFTSPYYFVPPSGTTAQRPSGEGLAPGTLRFNTDIGRLEVWRGDHWATILGESPSLNGGARGVFAGGEDSSGLVSTSHIGYINISSTGNSITFGSLSAAKTQLSGSLASSTRGLWAGGYAPVLSAIEFVTIASTGNSTSFGNLSIARWAIAGASNSTRGLFAGGTTGPGTIGAGVNEIDYVTIASTGNGIDFGDLQQEVAGSASCASSTRALVAGGVEDAPNASVNTINFITISTTGNAADFGDLIDVRNQFAGCSNATRGLFAGGSPTTNIIQYVTIATLGNAIDFGDLTAARVAGAGASSSTRGVFIAGGANPTATNVIDYVTILTTGNAIDFGDTPSSTTSALGACSNGHGGL